MSSLPATRPWSGTNCAPAVWPSPARTTRRLCRRKRLSVQSAGRGCFVRGKGADGLLPGGTRATVLGRQQAHRSDAGKQDSAIPTYGCFAFALKPYEGRLPKIEDAPLFHKSEQEFKSPELFSEKIINGFGISHIKNPQWIDNHGKRRIMRA